MMLNHPAPTERITEGWIAKLSVILLTLTTMGADVRDAFAQIMALKEHQRRALIDDLSHDDFPTREKAFDVLKKQITPDAKGELDVPTLRELRLIAKKDQRAQKTALEGFKRSETLVEQAYEKLMAETRAKKTKYPFAPKFMPGTNTKLPSNLTPWGPKNDVWRFMQPIIVERLSQSYFMNIEDTELRKTRTSSLDYYDAHEQGSFDDALNALKFRKTLTDLGQARNNWWNGLILDEERDRKARDWPLLLEP